MEQHRRRASAVGLYQTRQKAAIRIYPFKDHEPQADDESISTELCWGFDSTRNPVQIEVPTYKPGARTLHHNTQVVALLYRHFTAFQEWLDQNITSELITQITFSFSKNVADQKAYWQASLEQSGCKQSLAQCKITPGTGHGRKSLERTQLTRREALPSRGVLARQKRWRSCRRCFFPPFQE